MSDSGMKKVNCVTMSGDFIAVPPHELTLRPAAYGIIVADGKLLLLTMRHTGKYHLPGGGIEPGERIDETLRREIREETGIEIEVGPLVDLEELFFYYDPSQTAYHGLHLYYLCEARTTTLVADEDVEDGSTERPRWVPIGELEPAGFQAHGEKILAIVEQQQRLVT